MKKSLMRVNGLLATINTPEALKGEDTYGLPPYDECPAFDVDEYPACPANWMHGSDKASSYFVPVQAGRGMWFDFTPNEAHSHHVAVVISVQGVNPITGQRVSALNLEKYQNQCPVHKVPFQGGRFCPECGYSWPSQNYLATTTREILWIDGFRNEQGQVRQYIITEEEIRSVAKAVIGDDRVYAIGFAFYLSKNPKPGLTARTTPFGGTLLNEQVPPWYSPAGWFGGYSSSSCSTSCSSTSSSSKSSKSGSAGGFSTGFPPSSQISPGVNIPSVMPCCGGISQPDAIPDIRGFQTPQKSHICMKDTNDFIDLSQVTNRNSRIYPYNDAQTLQQLASGDGNLDMYYPTQMDEHGNEYSLEDTRYDVPAGEEDYWIPIRPVVLDPDSFCPRQEYAKLVSSSGHKIEMKDEVAQFKRVSIPLPKKKETKLEIGAGAKIWQDVGIDPENMDFWQSEPAGLIYVNYVSVEQAKEIMAAGKRGSKKDGFLAGVPVGN